MQVFYYHAGFCGLVLIFIGSGEPLWVALLRPVILKDGRWGWEASEQGIPLRRLGLCNT